VLRDRVLCPAVRDWIDAAGAKTAFIEPGSPWEKGYVESFNARFRDDLLNRQVFYSLREAQIITEGLRKHYNTKRSTALLDTGRRLRKPSCHRTSDQSCTNNQTEPVRSG
jgi:transposase InsO family protein